MGCKGGFAWDAPNLLWPLDPQAGLILLLMNILHDLIYSDTKTVGIVVEILVYSSYWMIQDLLYKKLWELW